MITLGSLSFAGPFLSPLWSPPRGGGLFAVMVPGWRLLTFRALYFGHAAELSAQALRAHARYAEWIAVAGTDWNLYVATHEMSFSTEAQREAAARELARSYRPEFREPDTTTRTKDAPSLGTLLLAQAMRENKG